ncbi:MAG: DNA alkylation repair protein [Flavobacterium sp.]|uniref:DNA alkylation repair protein n=1 Tax=Flavobacterium sp. TaxID=239 RepID=UPI001212DE05|nr:DNA alkylation repair protein [Flavobacterium sp.]RZJ64399.1 MAG: DNA alkylation repair protein [Flavobacterium sp.]
MFTAHNFILELHTLRSDDELRKIRRYFKSGEGDYGQGDIFMGVRMGSVFDLAKRYVEMSLDEIEKLLESDWHEARTGAVSIMDFQARNKKTSDSRRKELYDLYIRRHDRINNWDLVDRSAIWVVGGYLYDKPTDRLYELARSKNMWERRTAIVATAYFLKHKNVEHTFRIAELLVDDSQDLIHKAVGGWIRMAGAGTHRQTLIDFLDKHAATMPRVMLRYAIEKLDKNQREHYLKLKTK